MQEVKELREKLTGRLKQALEAQQKISVEIEQLKGGIAALHEIEGKTKEAENGD